MNDPPAGPIDLPAEWAEAPDLPPDWLATLDAVIRRGGGAHAGDKSDPFALSRAARFFGVAAEMCPGKDEDGRDRSGTSSSSGRKGSRSGCATTWTPRPTPTRRS
jgi:hypothetical protein